MTPVLDAVRREELRKLAEGATPGEWHTDDPHIVLSKNIHHIVNKVTDNDGGPEAWAITAYIAAMSPGTTLALLAYIAELEAGLEPFAKAADRADHNARLFDMTMAASEEMSPGLGIKFSHLRAARAALLPKASVREERG